MYELLFRSKWYVRYAKKPKVTNNRNLLLQEDTHIIIVNFQPIVTAVNIYHIRGTWQTFTWSEITIVDTYVSICRALIIAFMHNIVFQIRDTVAYNFMQIAQTKPDKRRYNYDDQEGNE